MKSCVITAVHYVCKSRPVDLNGLRLFSKYLSQNSLYICCLCRVRMIFFHLFKFNGIMIDELSNYGVSGLFLLK